MTAKRLVPAAQGPRPPRRIPVVKEEPALRITSARILRPSRKKPLRPPGDKSTHTDKQKRQAAHIEAGYEEKGLDTPTAKSIAWATVNKLSSRGTKAAQKVAKAK